MRSPLSYRLRTPLPRPDAVELGELVADVELVEVALDVDLVRQARLGPGAALVLRSRGRPLRLGVQVRDGKALGRPDGAVGDRVAVM